MIVAVVVNTCLKLQFFFKFRSIDNIMRRYSATMTQSLGARIVDTMAQHCRANKYA